MNISKSVTEALYIHRKNQKWLCEKLDCSPAYVSSICVGKKNIGRNKIREIAEAFGMQVSDFIKLGESNEAGE